MSQETKQVISLPGGGTIEVTHRSPWLGQIIAANADFRPSTLGTQGVVLDRFGVIVLQCGSYTDATLICEALNLWSRARILDGNT